MKYQGIGLFWIFIWSIFMGITAGSIGFGAAFPSLNLIAKPFVCPHGEMQLETQDYTPSPVETVTTLTWYCVDKPTGTRTELGIFPMSLYAGTIYGLILFAIIYIWMRVQANRSDSGKSSSEPSAVHRNEVALEQAEEFRKTAAEFRHQAEDFNNKSKASVDSVKRMKELKDLRDANLISESEYEQKRAEILKKL